MKGYKIFKINFNGQLQCRHYIFDNLINVIDDDVMLCENGFHFCTDINDCFKYYSISNIKNYIICEVEASGIITEAEDGCSKRACSEIKIIEKLELEKLYYLLGLENKIQYLSTNFSIEKLVDILNDYDYNELYPLLSKISKILYRLNLIELETNIIPILLKQKNKFNTSLYTMIYNRFLNINKHGHFKINLGYINFENLDYSSSKFKLNDDELYLIQNSQSSIISYYMALPLPIKITQKNKLMRLLNDLNEIAKWVVYFPEDKQYFINNKEYIKCDNYMFDDRKDNSFAEYLISGETKIYKKLFKYLTWEKLKKIYNTKYDSLIYEMLINGNNLNGYDVWWWLRKNENYLIYFKDKISNLSESLTDVCFKKLCELANTQGIDLLPLMRTHGLIRFAKIYPNNKHDILPLILNNKIDELDTRYLFTVYDDVKESLMYLLENKKCIYENEIQSFQKNLDLLKPYLHKLSTDNINLISKIAKKYQIITEESIAKHNCDFNEKIFNLLVNLLNDPMKLVKIYCKKSPMTLMNTQYKNIAIDYVYERIDMLEWISQHPHDAKFFVKKGLKIS